MRSFSGPGWISFSVSAERERERVQHLINLHEQPAAANEKDLKMSAVAAFAKALLRVAEFKRDTQTPSWLVHLIFNTTPSPDPYWCTILWDWISGLYNQVVKKCFFPPDSATRSKVGMRTRTTGAEVGFVSCTHEDLNMLWDPQWFLSSEVLEVLEVIWGSNPNYTKTPACRSLQW